MCADPSLREGTYFKEAFKAVLVGARSLQWTNVSIDSVSVEGCSRGLTRHAYQDYPDRRIIFASMPHSFIFDHLTCARIWPGSTSNAVVISFCGLHRPVLHQNLRIPV